MKIQNMTQKNNKRKEIIESPFSINLSQFNYNASWMQLITKPLDFKVCFNILIICETILFQLITENGFDTRGAMQSEIHRTVMVIINSNEIRSYLLAFIVEDTNQYTKIFTDQGFADRYFELLKVQGARNSKFKGVIPSISMSRHALLKYSIGYFYSLKGSLSTHPIYYPNEIQSTLNFPNKDITSEKMKNGSKYSEQFDKALNFVKDKFEFKNSHLEKISFEPTLFQKSCNIYVESTTSNEINFIPESEAKNELELERIRKINEEIKKNKGSSHKGPTKRKDK